MKLRMLSAGIGLLLVTSLAACSTENDAHVSCQDVLTQASYEVMRQLAAAGLAADPAALRDALPGEAAPSEIDAVELPEHHVLTEQYDDDEQAELLAALTSRMVGVGGFFDEQEFYAATSRDGACSDWLE